MKGNPSVIEQLQKLLNCELAARDQYMAHSRIYKDMGLNALFERLDHEMEEETEHADILIERMLFLESTPDFNQQDAVTVGSDIVTMLKNDLEVEYYVINLLKETIVICENAKDFDTRQLLMKLLDDSEMDHAYWLEQQLKLIGTVGMQNYLQSQMTSSSSTAA